MSRTHSGVFRGKSRVLENHSRFWCFIPAITVVPAEVVIIVDPHDGFRAHPSVGARRGDHPRHPAARTHMLHESLVPVKLHLQQHKDELSGTVASYGRVPNVCSKRITLDRRGLECEV